MMNGTLLDDIMANDPDNGSRGSVIQNLLMPAWLRLAFPSDSDQNGSVERLPIMQDSSSSSTWFSYYIPTNVLERTKIVIVTTLGNKLTQDPASLFHTLLVSIVSVTVFVKLWQAQSQWSTTSDTTSQVTTIK